ncbi:MAG: N-methyl-L-tryptophan oxidase [Isosphaeraceae bacterium]|nr:N-methyl-L-tryptophan oxidase [Isosphaeraceae bacterium]
MERLHARHVVLGAGAMGSAAAYHLAKRGEPVLLVEQFRLGHDRGSSHGAARITRHSYADERYARLMPAAFRAWRKLEADAGQAFYIRTGGVSFCPPGVDYVARVAASLAAVGVPHRRMSGRQWDAISPQFALPAAYDVVFEPDAGLLAAARALAAMIALAHQHGGLQTRLLEGCSIRRLDLDADRPTLVSDTFLITADCLIVAAGSWTGHLLPLLADRLRPERQQVLYVRPEEIEPYQIGRLPVFIFMGAGPQEMFYGMPDFLGGGVKVARHGGDAVDPDTVKRVVDDDYRALVRRFLRDHLPALAEAPIVREEICLYTVAPNEDFLLGPWPDRPDVLVASPCSGHGFKFSCLIGRLLADLATTGRTDIPIDAWRWA